MEYQKTINLLDNTQNQPSEFRTKKWVEIDDDSRMERMARIAELDLRFQS